MRSALRLIPPTLFLACSWTWVIGMFFPVYLTSEMGWHAWLVFAVPNVVGAASVGVLLRSPQAARAFIEKHHVAATLFGVWTFLFQLVIAAWLIRHVLQSLGPDELPWGLARMPIVSGLTGVFVVLVIGFACTPFRYALKAAVGVALVSAVCAAFGFAQPGSVATFRLPDVPVGADQMQLVLIAPAVVFGFLLCPYLDLTLNAVRRGMPEQPGRIAFIAGFCGPFLILIAMTLGYAGHWQRTGTLPVVILLHVVVQAAFTAGVHLRAVAAAGAFRAFDHQTVRHKVATVRLALFSMVATLAVPFGGVLSDLETPVEGTPTARVAYDVLIAPYGFVIPAYVYCCAVPLGCLRGWTFRARLVLFGVSVVAATPLMTASLLTRDTWGYAAGVGVVVVLPWVVGLVYRPKRRVAAGIGEGSGV